MPHGLLVINISMHITDFSNVKNICRKGSSYSQSIIPYNLNAIFCWMISSLKIKSLVRAEIFKRLTPSDFKMREVFDIPGHGIETRLNCITFLNIVYITIFAVHDLNISIKSICSTSSTKVDLVS